MKTEEEIEIIIHASGEAYDRFEKEHADFAPITVDKYGNIDSVDIKGIFTYGFKYGIEAYEKLIKSVGK